MAIKKTSSSREAAQQLQDRAIHAAPTFLQPEDVESVAEAFPSGVGLVRQKYRTENGTEYTSRGTALPYEEAIAQTNHLIISMQKAKTDPRSGVLIPGAEIVEQERLPFRTDGCAMVRKHRFKSVEVLHALMSMESYGDVFEILPISEEQLAKEKKEGRQAREAALRAAEMNGMAEAGQITSNFTGAADPKSTNPATPEAKRSPGRPKKVAQEQEEDIELLEEVA